MSLDVYIKATVPTNVYSANITHNLGQMAREVSQEFYLALWHPEDLKIRRAVELAPLIKRGLDELLAKPAHYRQFNPENGWGNYDNLVLFATEYLVALSEHPDGEVSTWT